MRFLCQFTPERWDEVDWFNDSEFRRKSSIHISLIICLVGLSNLKFGIYKIFHFVLLCQ